MVREILRQRWDNNRVKNGVGIGKKAVFVGNVDNMAKFIALENAKHLTGVVFNNYFRGLVVDKVHKQHQIGLGSWLE